MWDGLAGLEKYHLVSCQRRAVGDRRVWVKVRTRLIDGLRMDSRGLVAGRISSWGARRCLLLCGFCGSLRAFGASLLLSLWQILKFFSGQYRSVD